jgi:hypothetical protein
MNPKTDVLQKLFGRENQPAFIPRARLRSFQTKGFGGLTPSIAAT